MLVPPSTAKLVADQRKIEAAKQFPAIQALASEVNGVRSIIGYLETVEANVRAKIRGQTTRVIKQISSEVQRIWALLHPEEPIEGIHLLIPEDSDKAIEIGLKFYGIDLPSPRLTLSEGYRNCLGLCIFVAMIRLNESYDGPVVLDDIVSSLDRDHRDRVADVILGDLGERQILIFTHDREWFTELRARLPASQWAFKSLRPWVGPEIGLQWSESTYNFDDARALIPMNSEAAGNRTRAIMDSRLALVTEKLRLPLLFLRGDRNDQRTCVEFLERLISEGRNRFRKKDEAGQWTKWLDPIEHWQTSLGLLKAWANRSSHTGTLIATEAQTLIESCEKAYSYFYCNSCDDPLWISDQTTRERVQCGCGGIQWRYD